MMTQPLSIGSESVLWLCPSCGQVRESPEPLACTAHYHAEQQTMVRLVEGLGWLNPTLTHPAFGKTSADPGYEWLADTRTVAVLGQERKP